MRIYSHRAALRCFLSLFAMVFSVAAFVPAQAATGCNGQEGYFYENDKKRNPRPGGFVSFSASVDEYSEIAPTAEVCDSAIVEYSTVIGKAWVGGDAFVKNSKVMGNARVGGDAYVEKATLRGFFEIYTGELKEGTHTAEKSASKPQGNAIRLSKEETLAYINRIIQQAVGKPVNDEFSRDLVRIANEMGSISGDIKITHVCDLSFNKNSKTYTTCSGRRVGMNTGSGEYILSVERKYLGFKLKDAKNISISPSSSANSPVKYIRIQLNSKTASEEWETKIYGRRGERGAYNNYKGGSSGTNIWDSFVIPYFSNEDGVDKKLINALKHLQRLDAEANEDDPF